MNERIRELVRQAGGIGYDDDGNELTPALVGSGLEKFAELIVKECADIANKQFSVASGLNDRDSWTAAEIKKHFGVEP